MNHPSHDDGLLEHCPWLFAGQASKRQRAAQEQRQKRLFAAPGEVRLGEDCFVAESAAVHPDVLHLGDRSYIAAHDADLAEEADVGTARPAPLSDLLRRAAEAGHGPHSVTALTEMLRKGA
ncbi:hypothetical protein [Streptomyces collinus]|uniref:hypothetical protein n=1 Tax=Streptomyces collinus TaxID=42684 RepID=UPI0037D62705